MNIMTQFAPLVFQETSLFYIMQLQAQQQTHTSIYLIKQF